jgi:hypothetical protein
MAKDKKATKAKPNKPKLERISSTEPAKAKSKKKGGTKAKAKSGLDAIGKVLDHPLVADLIAVGALAAVAAIAESGKLDPTKIKSSDAVKGAGKAAAAAIGARLLNEVTGGNAKKADAKKA